MRGSAAVVLTAVALALAACGQSSPAAGAGALGYAPKSAGELRARELASLVHGKFAYVGRAGTAGHVYEVSGPGLSDLFAVRFDEAAGLDSVGFDPLPVWRGGWVTLFTTG